MLNKQIVYLKFNEGIALDKNARDFKEI